MKDFQEDIEVKLKSSDTGVEYHEKASASECELTKECYISVWPRQKHAFAFDLGAGFDFEGASDLCIGFRIDDGNMRYAKTLKAKTRQHTYEEAHVYADAALIGDVASRTESKVLPFEFMATDGVKSSVFTFQVPWTQLILLHFHTSATWKAGGDSATCLKARIRNVLTSVAYTPRNDKSHVSRGPYQPEKFHWTPAKGDSGRELKFIFLYAAALDAEKARAAKDDCDDDEPMPSKRIKTELQTQETPEKISKEPTSVSESSIHDTTANGAIGLRAQREREKKRAEIRRQLREIELERKLAELED
ncbi:hypothetical protein KC361_g2194 [Hortaea werneckii]|nr:hypothetical protein KC361_g2194 [Hortaea werneckii]